MDNQAKTDSVYKDLASVSMGFSLVSAGIGVTQHYLSVDPSIVTQGLYGASSMFTALASAVFMNKDENLNGNKATLGLKEMFAGGASAFVLAATLNSVTPPEKVDNALPVVNVLHNLSAATFEQ